MKAIYAGSFDPPTLGHHWVIEQAAAMFPNNLTVAIGTNPEKEDAYSFSLEKRTEWLRIIAPDGVCISSFNNQYLVKHAEEIGAQVIVRGVRNVADFAFEYAMRHINSDLQDSVPPWRKYNPELTTIFLIPPRHLVEVSSSFVKGLIGPEGWQKAIIRYLPQCVYQHIISMEVKE